MTDKERERDRIESAIRHIKTAVDVDPMGDGDCGGGDEKADTEGTQV